MNAFIVNNTREPAYDDMTVVTWIEDPRIRLGPSDMRPRTTREMHWLHLVVLHTTKGIPGGSDQRPQDIRPGRGPASDVGARVVNWWTRDGRSAGAHLVVDFDGTIFQCADLLTEATHHAAHANGPSIGVEIAQGRDAELYEGQLDATVRLCDWLTKRFTIQRQIPHRYLGGPVPRLARDVGDVVGVVGHRDLTNRRGAGDPGSKVINMLGLAGYEPVDYSLDEDRDIWRRRQREMGLRNADGIAGPSTAAALRASGHAAGLYVTRPGDEL